MTTLEQLQRILRESFDIKSQDLARDTRLDALGIDSLKTIEILFQVEDAFGIRVPSVQEQPMQSLQTVGEVVDLIDGLLAQKAAAQGAS
jgi:acyl carrier protein